MEKGKGQSPAGNEEQNQPLDPARLCTGRKELVSSTGLQQESSQALRSVVGQRSKSDTYFPSSAIHIAPNLIPIRYTEAAAKELL